MDTIMETPDRERALLQQRAASASAVTSFPGQTPDNRELLSTHPHLQHQIKSSPTSASSDSFSSYIHKDAAIIQHRSSSPRADSGSQASADGPGAPGSPRSRVQARLDAVALDGHRRLPSFDFSRPMPPIRSVSATTPIRGGNFPAVVDRRSARSQESVAVDVSQLRERPRSQPEPFAPMSISALYHQPTHEGLSQWEREGSVASVAFTADGKDDDKHGQRDDAGRAGEIRRRRRTRPDEANLLVRAYADNAFPNQETRQQLADQLGMTVRAVSVWFQNRRQAEKKRSGRYGGSGILGGGASAADPSADLSSSATAATKAAGSEPESVVARPPLASTPKDPNNRPARASLPEPIKYTQANKENVPPWAAATAALSRGDDGTPLKVPKLEPQDDLLGSERPVSETPAASSHRTRDPSAAADTVSRKADTRQRPASQMDRVLSRSSATPSAVASTVSTAAPRSTHQALSRVRSAPRLSLDEVLARRACGLSRSVTEYVRTHDRSSDIEDEVVSTILPPRKVLSRAGSASSLSLVTTAGGRASLGSPASHATESAAAGDIASLNSRLPPAVTASLQRNGVISKLSEEEHAEQQKAKLVWQRMESSSASSSDPDRALADGGVNGLAHPKDSEEDEETTLRIIANRRAARAQALGRGKPAAADADARTAIQQHATAASDRSHQLASAPSQLGLVKRVPSLDWAAGRDRSVTPALPQRTVSSPLARTTARTASTHKFASPAKPRPKDLQKSAARRASAQAKKAAAAAPVRLAPAMSTPLRKTGAAAQQQASRPAVAVTPAPNGGRTSPRKKAAGAAATATATPQQQPQHFQQHVNDENVFGGATVPSPAFRSTPGSPKRRRVEHVAPPAPSIETAAAPHPSVRTVDRVLGSPMFAPRGMMHPHSFPASSTYLSTPRPLGSSPFKGPLSTRSERIGYRGLGAGSPSASPALRDYGFEQPRVRSFQSARESSARDQRRPLAERGPFDSPAGSRTPSHDSNDSGAASNTSDEWVSNLAKAAVGSASAATSSTPAGGAGSSTAKVLSATPSRIFADRSSVANLTMSAERMGPSANRHDDSGFFGSDESEDEQPAPASVVVRQKKTALSASASRWAKSRSSPVVPRKRKAGDAAEDQHAAELLLGLGQRHEAQSQ
ncbi:uncharacterized protein PFL1_00388 [Pseudozyma flocculosa PF-1]|uniref:Homeobox domain-containing protein n=1 Tax=Pseudozyma flocculosa TaxID=84751 RepID=A0A5C3ER94_9BASI|nr:uncharacterized protein PFL1_00388 [Pseudozyma flocculosa PF-1]EPQ32191.1 hypothetical protein PFL1_00388 [Pseudozyma flocculosa PF-1]SPO34864.1 uncharacterized protein PSFLO_00335 [Pseudozyma flocculosa]